MKNLEASRVCIRESKCDIFIGKGSRWEIPKQVRQDPRSLKGDIDRNMMYASWIEKKISTENFANSLKALRGKKLGCVCNQKSICHGDVLVAFINGL